MLFDSVTVAAPRLRDTMELTGVLARRRTAAPAHVVAHAGTCALAAAAPFELTRPLVTLPWQSISTVEAVIFAAVAAWSAALLRDRRWPRLPTPLTVPWLVTIAVMVAAALASPVSRTNALHMTARAIVAFAVFLMTVDGADTPARLRRAVIVAAASGVVVAVLTILEYLQIRAVLDALQLFRPGIAVIGGHLRAGGPLQYPTIASMSLEIAFALGLGMLVWTLDEPRRGAAAVFLAMAIIAEAIVFTFTRAGLLTMASSVSVVAWWRWRSRGFDRTVRAIVALTAAIVVLFVVSRPRDSVWLRLTTDGQEGWYRSVIAVPASLSLATGGWADVPVSVSNTGRVIWDSRDNPPFYLSYHWLQADADRVISYDGVRTPFPTPVAPDATERLVARVHVPPYPGQFRLAWDLVQEGRLWFSTEPGGTLTFTNATVAGPLYRGPIATWPLPRPVQRPSRRILWPAAARMIAAHPLLGVGPDNYRFVYGTYAGLPAADNRIHSNNMYLEMAAGCGIAGAIAFAWLVWRVSACARLVYRATAEHDGLAPAIGVAAAIVAIGVHGIFDTFLGFTPTYVLIALTLGLAAAAASRANDGTHADRI